MSSIPPTTATSQSDAGSALRTADDASPVGPAAAHAATMVEAFAITSAALGGRVAIRTKGDAQTLTWAQWHQRSQELAGGLHRLGLRRGETLALLLGNRPEFHVADMAAVLLGATPFSIYQTYAANQIEFVISDADARIAIVERQYLDRLLQARRNLPHLEHVILVDPDGAEPDSGGQSRSGTGAPGAGSLPAGVRTLADVEASGRDEQTQREVAEAAAQVGPEDILTLIYTSGTTGPPKGVQLCHRNLLSAVTGIERMVQFPAGSRVISWLPAAHIAERGAHHYLPIVYGLQITSCPDPREVMAYLPEVRPQWFFAVPRIWEKLKAGLETMLAGLPDEQRERTERALGAAVEKVRLEQRGEPVPAELTAEVALADEQIFAGLRAMLGFDQVKAVNVGAAPTPVEVLELFHAIGIPLSELWGMSETCGAGCVNPPEKIKLGTVGPPAPGVELSIADDGEVLVRGDVVMLGYRNAPEKTAEAIDADGWLHTGDIGELDDDGYLKIVDRKKELIINAAGKNMSPANIEAAIKSASPLIGQACAIGDARPYNTALIVLDADFAPLWAAKHALAGRTLEELADEPAMRAAVQQAIDAANSTLARVEQIKKFTIVRGDWLAGQDELTPTMKLKRKPIAAKYAAAIEAMYA
ncbi:MAG TPA: AMP-dependent synthetase/ligase [Solirubrobacteraceae bacterium]|jgi:long-chain acyl-CoA synthetase|nr:AMP-dependent synthetase/ligase [Solirubrobacteraceae bacterium]